MRVLLTTFVRNPDVDVRRRILPHLELRSVAGYPEELRPMVAEAIAIARAHPDEYIRHRLEVQLGNAGTLMALPPRPRSA